MAAIVLKRFGGILPSVEPRDLPPPSAQVAHNLSLRYGDFRPLKGPGASVAAVVAGAQSIFRTPSGVWLSSVNDVNYVNAQVIDAGFERVYLTGRSAFPEAWQDDAYRQLGVPAPAAAPTLVFTESGEFSAEELETSRNTLPATVARMFQDALIPINLGNAPTATPPVVGVGGWLPHGALPALPTNSNLQWAFMVPMVASGAVFVMQFPEEHNHLLAPELGGKQVAYLGNQYWAVPVYWQGQGQEIDAAGLDADFRTVMSPADPLVRLWDDAKVAAMVSDVVYQYDVAREPRRGLINAINAAQELLGRAYAGAVVTDEIRNAMAAFFLRADIVAQIDGLIGTSGGHPRSLHDADAGTYAVRLSGYCYNLGTMRPDGTANTVPDTRYFHVANDDPTAINLRADINSFISVDSRGVKVLDTVGLTSKLTLEMNAISDQRPLGERWPEANIAARVADCVGIAASVFNDANWAKNPAWPLASSSWRTASTLTARDQLRQACDALTLHFDGLRQSILDYVRTTLFEEHVIPLLPAAVERVIETRAYIVTYVTDRGEESAPSEPSILIEVDQNDTVDVTVAAPPGGRHITHFRVYRSSSTNTAGQAAFQRVPNAADDFGWPIGTLTMTDDRLQEDLRESCPSITWTEPRADLFALVGMPNGIMAALADNGRRLCFCVPFHPYAWPREYEIPLEFLGVGLGVFGQTLVVPTEGQPYYASGADSASMSAQKLESPQSCVSKRSIVSAEGGVFYASPDGICLAGPGGVQVVSLGAYSRDDWQALGVTGSFAAFSEGVYYIWTTA